MKRFGLLIACAPALLLIGCGSNVKETLGLERSAPDEFAVVERAPLVVPPNFNLVPPQPGAPRPQDETADASAKNLVLGSQSSAPKSAGSAAEQNFLKQAGAAQVNPNIRQQVNAPDASVPKTTAEKLGIVSPTKKGTLDPVAEAKSLKQKNVKTVPIEDAKADDAK